MIHTCLDGDLKHRSFTQSRTESGHLATQMSEEIIITLSIHDQFFSLKKHDLICIFQKKLL